MIPNQIALVSDTKTVKFPEIMRVAAALQKQASRDLEPIWGVSASIRVSSCSLFCAEMGTVALGWYAASSN